jgi:HEAT repeat protein
MRRRLLQILLVCLAVLLGREGGSSVWAQGEVAAKKPMPADFPPFRRTIADGFFLMWNGVGRESEFTNIGKENRELVGQLSGYTSESIAAVLGERMKREQDVHLKLFLAALAAEHGDRGSIVFIWQMGADAKYATNYAITLSRLSALGQLLRGDHPQDWVFEAVHQALGDTRLVLDWRNPENRLEYTISFLADKFEHLTSALGRAKNPKSVPVLAAMANRNPGSDDAVTALGMIGDARAIPVLAAVAKRNPGSYDAVTALGMIGDARAIPVCLELLQHADQAIKKKDFSDDVPPRELTEVLGKLKAREAVPTLLTYLHSADVIHALGEIGDDRAVEALQRIFDAQGRVDPDPYSWEQRFQERTFAARVALIKLKHGDPIPKWLDLLQDRSLSATQRWQTVKELRQYPDPRLISPLLELVKTDPEEPVVSRAIEALSAIRYKAVVAGLIECFDVRFPVKPAQKGRISPAELFGKMAGALKSLTGKSFGPVKADWEKWWNEEGKNLETLK